MNLGVLLILTLSETLSAVRNKWVPARNFTKVLIFSFERVTEVPAFVVCVSIYIFLAVRNYASKS